MVFSSLIFIYLFLPLTLLFYNLCSIVTKKSVKLKLQNLVLLLFSLLFYVYGEPKLIVILIISVIINYIFGRLMDKKYKKIYLILAIIFNMATLIYFKYTNFFVDSINSLIHTNIQLKKIIMPIGISFYTFQAMSYVIDSYRNPKIIQKSLVNLMLYITMFPQLIAGPIVRYDYITSQISDRKVTLSKFSSGINRFMQGLAKKVLLANSFAVMADYVFELKTPGTMSLAWFGAIAYTLQIYYDFSGYSDMAIGLRKNVWI